MSFGKNLRWETQEGSHSRRLIVLALALAFTFIADPSGHLLAADPLAQQPGGAPTAQFGDQLPADPSPEQSQQIQRLIEQLGNPNYFAREQAQRDLSKLGLAAFDALCVAQSSANVEIAARARFLVQSLKVDLSQPDDPPAIRDVLKAYASADENARREKITELGQLPEYGGLTALCRLARFESSEILSKLAAVTLISLEHPQEINWSAQQLALNKVMGSSQRRAVNWLRTFLRWQTAPSPKELEEAAAAWADHAAAETQLLQSGSTNSSREALTALLKTQVQFLTRLGRHEQVTAAVIQVVTNDPGTTESVALLVRWIATQKQWSALDGLEQRFADAFTKDPLLWYELAEARHVQGQIEVAQAHAKRGLEPFSEDISARFRVGLALRQRGLMRWCESEIRQCLKEAPKTDRYAIFSRTFFSEILHDRMDNQEAAEMIRLALEGMEENDKNNRPDENPFNEEYKERRVKELKSRMHFFLAMHFRESDPAKHEHHLDQAIAVDPTDADALIALHRLPNATEERRKRTSQLIREAVASFREQVKKEAQNPTPFNQHAWLVGNTEGDFQEAIEMSKKSLELRPNTAAYLDTLGRCYFAAGDYANAIRYQTMAVAREPWSQQMQRQLQIFRKAQHDDAGKP